MPEIAVEFSEYRSPGDRRRFHPWVRELVRKNGVYIIRSKGTKRVYYIGESHTGKLYETLTRHFQDWNGHTAGPTYHRMLSEVAVAIVDRRQAVAVQNALIATMDPEDNRRLPEVLVAEDEVPF